MPSPILSRVADRMHDRPADPRLVWRQQARPEQMMPGGDWRVWYVQGGRGSGKTRSGAGALAEIIAADPDEDGQFGIVAPTYRDAWTVCVEGEAGILRALGTSAGEVKEGTSQQVAYAHRSYGEIGLRSGHVIYVDSADDGALRVQGKNLRAIWADEVGLWLRWETAWNESIRYAVRRGASRIIATGTPKASRPARRLIRSLIRKDPEHGGVVVTRLRTIDNAANLSESFMRAVVGASQGTRLERQELEGELLDDVANALWTRELIDSIRVTELPGNLRDCTLGVDPSDGGETSDEQAYTLAGMGMPEDRHIYVVENWGGQEAPAPFAKRCIRVAQEWGATIVVEKNHGGKWLTTVFHQVQKELGSNVRVQMVHASDAKRTRAEPVAAMYERYSDDGRPMVLHLHRHREDARGNMRPDEHMPELEDQMAVFTGAQGERSPDRLDSAVWALSGYLRKTLGPPGPSGPRKWAAQKELDELTPKGGPVGRRLLRVARGPDYAGSDTWDLDSFAPAEDREAQDARPVSPRGNVKQWGGRRS